MSRPQPEQDIPDELERARTKAELRRSQAQAWAILTTSADAIISIDDHHLIREWNNGAEHIFGYTRAEALGMSLDRVLPERYRANHHEHMRRFAAEAENARSMDHQSAVGLRKNGQEFPISATISRLEIDGELILTVAVRDATEQKRVENEQRVLAEFGAVLASLDYEQTLHCVAEFATRCLTDFAVLFVTTEDGAELRRVAASSREPDQAQLANKLFSASKTQDATDPIWQAVLSGNPISVALEPESTTPAVRPGPMPPRNAVVLPLLVAGKCVGALGLASSQRAFEERDIELAQEIARRCALFVEHARLHRAEQRATRARDEALSIVAHDLRNPVAAILLQASLLKQSDGEPERRSQKHSEAITRAANQMNRIIEDLLDVSQLEAGRLTMEPARVCARELIAEVADMHAGQAAARSLQLLIDVAEPVPDVWGDRRRMLQALDNLVGNATKFTHHGTVSIGVKASAGQAVFWVADTGVGIAADHLPHLFDRFWQARNHTRGGAGLGLAIVKGIVEAHGGRAWVESRVGVGSTFSFSIPIATASP